jgi:hypothetical protein
MKPEKRFTTPRAARCGRSPSLHQEAQLAAAGYPKFLSRLAVVVRRLRLEHPGNPRRHD